MNRWGVLILVAPALLLVGSVLYEPEALGHPAWQMLAILLVAIFGFLALLASTSVSRIGRAITVTVALILEGLIGFFLWWVATPLTEELALG